MPFFKKQTNKQKVIEHFPASTATSVWQRRTTVTVTQAQPTALLTIKASQCFPQQNPLCSSLWTCLFTILFIYSSWKFPIPCHHLRLHIFSSLAKEVSQFQEQVTNVQMNSIFSLKRSSTIRLWRSSQFVKEADCSVFQKLFMTKTINSGKNTAVYTICMDF